MESFLTASLMSDWHGQIQATVSIHKDNACTGDQCQSLRRVGQAKRLCSWKSGQLLLFKAREYIAELRHWISDPKATSQLIDKERKGKERKGKERIDWLTSKLVSNNISADARQPLRGVRTSWHIKLMNSLLASFEAFSFATVNVLAAAYRKTKSNLFNDIAEFKQ